MKKYLLLFPFLLAAPLLHADSCCSTSPTPAAADAPLPGDSVYHLEGSWTAQDGTPTRLADFKGRPQLVTMFFSSCTYACPMLVEDLKRLMKDLPEPNKKDLCIALLSFDTERDQPAVLAEFAKLRGLPTPPWTLLHGSEDDVRETAAVLGVRYRQDKEGNFAHANIITLLDRQGKIVYQLNGLRADSAPLIQAIQSLQRP